MIFTLIIRIIIAEEWVNKSFILRDDMSDDAITEKRLCLSGMSFNLMRPNSVSDSEAPLIFYKILWAWYSFI